MSSTSAQQQQAPAPWRDTFLSHINSMPSPEFVLATLHPAPKGSPTPYLPRARTCIFRGFWGELPENKHNDAPQNARVFESDLPTFTTDVRMQKAGEVFASSAGKADDDSLVQGSGGGGWCEAVWWAKEPSVQWRVRGRAFVVARDIEGEQGSEEGSGVRTVKSEVGGRMRVVKGKEEEKAEWSWRKELTAHFGNMSPTSKGMFAAPPPGRPVDEPIEGEHLDVGAKVEDLQHPIARRNFRVVIIAPEEVESVDLSDPNTARRQFYTFDAASGTWKHQELWP